MHLFIDACILGIFRKVLEDPGWLIKLEGAARKKKDAMNEAPELDLPDRRSLARVLASSPYFETVGEPETRRLVTMSSSTV